MSLKIWFPFSKNFENNGLLSGVTTSKTGTISISGGGPFGGYLVAGDGTQKTNGISVNTNLLDVLTGTSSVSVFVKPNGQHVHYNGTIISSGNWNNKRWAFGVNSANTKVDVFGPGHNIYVNCTVPVGEWTHLVSIYDKINKKAYLYKNAQFVSEFNYANYTFSSDATNFCVGRETYAGGYFSFNGNISDLRIYDHGLSEDDIKRLYMQKTFEIVEGVDDVFERGGMTLGDLTKYNMSYTSNTLVFNGSTAAVKIPFNKLQNGAFSMNVWFFRSDYGSDRWETIFGGPSGFEIETKPSSSSTSNIIAYSWGGNSAAKYIPYENNVWNMLTMTRTSSKSCFYLNGELKYTGSAGSIPSGDYFVGAWQSYGGQNFKGKVSKFSIFSKALSENEIKLLYEDGFETETDFDLNYTKLGYIQSTGTQWIDTGVNPKIKPRVVAKFKFINNNDTDYWGNNAINGSAYYADFSSRNLSYYRYGSTTYQNVPCQVGLNELHIWDVSKEVYVDGVLKFTSQNTYTYNASQSNIYIFKAARANYYSSYQLYDFQLYDGDDLVRHFIPSKRNSDNVVGLYDMVTKTFFTNSGSGDFIEGPEIYEGLPNTYQQLEYIQSTGTQLISINYKPNQNTEIESRWSNKTNGYFIYGCGVSNYLTAWAADSGYNWRFGGIALSPAVTYTSTGDNIIIQNRYHVLINGVEKGVYTNVNNFTSTANLSLFGDLSGNYSSQNNYPWVSSRCHYFKVKENGNLIAFLVPSKRKSDNVIGMYDLVTNTFFTNAGTGTFTAGPEV